MIVILELLGIWMLLATVTVVAVHRFTSFVKSK